jgi:nucleotide-binding universal stress UspA family protein
MKLLIAYDGSQCAEAAIDDLTRAGLPEKCAAMIVSVAEVWLPPPNDKDIDADIKLDPQSRAVIERHICESKRVVAEAQTLANHAKNRIKEMFPHWTVKSQATYGSPAFEILSLADDLRSDLVVVGSHGRSGFSRLFLGSVSQKVVTEAKCSVRVGRGRIETDPGPERIMIGFDGTKGAIAAVAVVSKRKWAPSSEVQLVTATESVTPVAIGRFISPTNLVVEGVSEDERKWVEKQATVSIRKLSAAGFNIALQVKAGNPKQLLIQEAEHWGADCIFVGANAVAGQLENFLIGSTSAAVAARAHCSVEVVRG